MSFHVGQQVVCVDDTDTALVVKGCVYTVARVCGDGYSVRRKEFGPGLKLIEASPANGMDGFCASRFRPVKQTSIEVFRQLLVNPKVDA